MPDKAKKTAYSIADLSQEFCVTHRAIRFYEDQGLISPERSGQARIYSPRDRARLAMILRGKRVGFSLADIREMINLYDQEDGPAKQRHVALKKCMERIEALKQQRIDIDITINELEEYCLILEDLIDINDIQKAQ